MNINTDLNYLNMQEIKYFCNKVGIPYKIQYQCDDKVKTSGETDRKGIILKRIRTFLKTKDPGAPTVYLNKVTNFEPLPASLQATDKIYYGQYKNTNKKSLSLLKELTNNQFKFGAISQEVIREFWTNGIAPTYKQFANAWLKANKEHNKPNEEWAFLTDLSLGMDMKDWKKYRKAKAVEVLKYLNSFIGFS